MDFYSFVYISPGDVGTLSYATFYKIKDTITAFKIDDQLSCFICFSYAWQIIIIYFQAEAKRAQFTIIETLGEYLMQFVQVNYLMQFVQVFSFFTHSDTLYHSDNPRNLPNRPFGDSHKRLGLPFQRPLVVFLTRPNLESQLALCARVAQRHVYVLAQRCV